jgi:hypothetical protein
MLSKVSFGKFMWDWFLANSKVKLFKILSLGPSIFSSTDEYQIPSHETCCKVDLVVDLKAVGGVSFWFSG